MKTLALILLLVISLSGFAQRRKYFDRHGEETNQEEAVYYKTKKKLDNGIWEFKTCFMDDSLKQIAFALKKNGSQKVGKHVWYHSNRNLQKEIEYDNDIKNMVTYYYPNGTLRKKVRYENTKVVFQQKYSEKGKLTFKFWTELKNDTCYKYTESYYQRGVCKHRKEYHGEHLYSEDLYYPSNSVKHIIRYVFSEGKELKSVQSFYETGELMRCDRYKKKEPGNGFGKEYELLEGHCYDKQKNEIEFKVFDRLPEFPGGVKELKKYIGKTVEYPLLAQVGGESGKVYVRFLIDKMGHVTSPKVVKCEGNVSLPLRREALRVVNSIPDFVPGIAYGELARISYTVPINFTFW